MKTTKQNDEHSNADDFAAWLESEHERDDDAPKIEAIEVKNWTIPVGKHGDEFARMQLDTAEGFLSVRKGEALFYFELQLGPVNARKLIDFLRALPTEPDDEDKPAEG